ncbi:acetate kinase [Enterococcus sp. PF1-24]|uniref:acetate/propionate family kinase n=1 Tax=unclassified Enterococcus TaxID=2608891 RepID=UPI002476CC69|nr:MULTISPECIES: acetate kinase [unclassified Enterococcus]MDH6365443.1 acetate kinase [Enterococcus sp. PFB1-1]MDH6402544.1 acetate kinase [Enterococcus sp. PF1-24]
MPSKIMAINAGSSSLKFQLYEMPAETLIIKGLFERIGSHQTVHFTYSYGSQKNQQELAINNHQEVVNFLLDFLISQKIVTNLDELAGVGHRVAHGGEDFSKSTVVDEVVENKIAALCQLAPLHNPVNLAGIQAFKKAMPQVTQVAVFDTAFHQSMPAENYLYPLPYEIYQKQGVRKYGFHGTSHQYVVEQVAVALGENLQQLKIISCHLGNGASVCSVKNGQSYNTSMGFTPLAGLMMGTRCGDIDPSIVTYLQKKLNLSPDEVENMMNQESGLLGVSGLTNDFRDVLKAANEGDQRAQLALNIFTNRVKSTIGAYAAEMGGVDAIVFTAGIGENASLIRSACCEDLSFLGIKIDEKRNQENQRFIQKDGQPVYILVVPTNEELKIVQDTYQLV